MADGDKPSGPPPPPPPPIPLKLLPITGSSSPAFGIGGCAASSGAPGPVAPLGLLPGVLGLLAEVGGLLKREFSVVLACEDASATDGCCCCWGGGWAGVGGGERYGGGDEGKE